MAKVGMTIDDAAHEWVREMNAYPQDMIQMLMQAAPDDWQEVTTPCRCDRVYVYSLPDKNMDGEPYESTECCGEITKCLENGTYIIEMDNGESIIAQEDDFEVERDDTLPMWGWMWGFSDSADDYFMDELDGIKKMSKCGFRIYKHEKWGYFFGIDGAGYSFYEEHWIPLYKKRGLQWHDPKAEQEHRMTMRGCKKGKLGNKEYWFMDDEIVEEVL